MSMEGWYVRKLTPTIKACNSGSQPYFNFHTQTDDHEVRRDAGVCFVERLQVQMQSI